MLGLCNRFTSVRDSHFAGGPCFIIGNSLEVVGDGESGCKTECECWFGQSEPVELFVNALVRLGNFAGTLEYQSLRGMKLRVVGKASSLTGNVDCQDLRCIPDASRMASSALSR